MSGYQSGEFVETGQTFTDDGAAYCPVERKDGGAVGVAAALGVLASGAAFLIYAMTGAAPEAEVFAAAPADPAPQIITADAPAPVGDAPAPVANALPASVEPAPAATEAQIADALAESRAARAAARNPFAFRAPSLKGALHADAGTYFTSGEAFAPRLKPAPKAVAAAAQPAARPTPIRTAATTPEQPAAPPTFYYLPPAREKPVRNPAVAYVRDVDRDIVRTSVTIGRGETFVDALKRAGVAAADRNAAAYAFGKHYNLRRLKPGQEFKLALGWPNQTLFQLAATGEPDARLLSLDFRDGFEKIVSVRRNLVGSFDAEAAPVPLTTELHAIEGRIEGSLYVSAKALGAPDDIIASLADVFAYDVDFQREIFGGDEFEVIFEARYDDRGQMAGGGDILFARLNWRGRSREKGYYRFASDDDGDRADFYDASGQSAKRLLMKTPIDGARLSSRFGTRKHPILGYRRAHKGVDFAARRGTPIKAAGDGVVERADRYGSFGNYIRIRHANGYKTAYAHLNGFRKGIRKGKRVRQGDIIGYVGTTGRSTGPHLHYEVHLNGKAVNPQKLKIATGKQLKGAELDRFKMVRDRIDLMRQPAAEDAPLYAEGEETPTKESL